jgi:hypothetical protein
MVSLQTGLTGRGDVPLVLLWSVTLFCDIQTAVEAGNGALRKKFRGVERKKTEILCHQVERACLGGDEFGNFRAKKNLFFWAPVRVQCRLVNARQ